MKKPQIKKNNLASINEINLDYILKNEEILDTWKSWQDKLSSFNFIDFKGGVNSIKKKPWLNYGMTKSPVEMIKELNVSHVDFVEDISINYLKKTPNTFDFIFLDGDHTPSTVYQEIPLALDKLNKGGIILIHDYFPNVKPLWPNNYVVEGPYLATKRLISETDIDILPLGSLPWKTKFDSNRTSLALCLKK